MALPELTGIYEFHPYVEPNLDAPSSRTMSFTLPESITEIDELGLVISGQWNIGEVTCDSGFPDPDISPLLPPVAMFITSSAFPGDYFFASIQLPDGPFENLTAEFSSGYPPGVLDFNQLIGPTLDVDFFIDMALIGICWVTVDTYGTLDEVSLQITGPVATQNSHWDRVKSLYR